MPVPLYEAKAKGVKVTYKPNIGSRETTYGLLKNGSISVLPEYNGALLAYLDPKAAPKTVEETTSAIEAKLDSKLTLLDPADAQDKDTVTLNATTAAKYNLTEKSSIADLKNIAKDLVIGASPELVDEPPAVEVLDGCHPRMVGICPQV
ncbi:glycine betaine ABC transporter substrate-binding protein, partial [Streptomyces sp. NPDC005921]